MTRFETPWRVVIKVGSSVLRGADGGLDRALAESLVDQVATVRRQGVEVVLVSSGAVAAGLAPLGMTKRPADLPSLQAAASVGQGLLMHVYQSRFAIHGMACGQVLLTPDDVVERTRYLNARHTFDRLLSLGAVPIVNENDTVATDELRFGDNDRLAALAASMLNARLLVLLSDVEGLLDGDPLSGAELPLIERVEDWSTLDARHYGRTGSELGSGGMASKLEAVRIATFSAAHAVIAHGRRRDVIPEAVSGAGVGTWFPPSGRRPESRKLWIAFAHTPQGSVEVDSGAARALLERGSSLLAVGVVDASGAFAAGDSVDVVGPDRRLIARGLVSYSRDEVLGLRGRSSSDLDGAYRRAVIHRDSLVIIAS